jgi:hypothetical protein
MKHVPLNINQFGSRFLDAPKTSLQISGVDNFSAHSTKFSQLTPTQSKTGFPVNYRSSQRLVNQKLKNEKFYQYNETSILENFVNVNPTRSRKSIKERSQSPQMILKIKNQKHFNHQIDLQSNNKNFKVRGIYIIILEYV